MRNSVALVIHDVAPATLAQCRKLIGLIESVVGAGAVPLTLLIVPHYHGNIRMDRDPAWRAWIEERAAKGDELALHGYFHTDDGPPAVTPREWFARRVLTDGEAEFSALSAAVAQCRIEHGLQLFASCGWSACGFVPPAWQLGQAAGTVLRAFALAYTTTRTQLIRIGSQDAWHSPALSLSGRSELRRRCSRLYANRWCVQYRCEPFVRLALHPADAHHPELLQTWVVVLQRVLADRNLVTKEGWLQRQLAHRPQPVAVRTS